MRRTILPLDRKACRVRHWAVLLLLVLPSAADRGAAQAVESAPLSLIEAVRRARREGPRHRLAEAQHDVSLGRVLEGTQWANPTLEWRRENLGSSLQPDIFVTALVPFDLSGRRIALRQSAGAGRARVEADRLVDLRQADLEVARAWIGAARTRMNLDLTVQQAEALREIAVTDSIRLHEGLVSEAVGLRTALEADRARVAVTLARRDADRAQAELARLVGGPATPASLEVPPLPTAPDSATALALALRTRPDVIAREAAVRETARRLSAEQRGIFGEVQLQGGTKQTSGVLTGQIGLAMPLPLFHRNDGARDLARGEALAAAVQLDDLRMEVEGAIRVALAHYREVLATRPSATTFLSRGRDVRQIARTAYAEGHITLVELLDAERASTDAARAWLDWIADAWLSRLELESAIGARLDDTGPLDLPPFSPPPPGR